MKRSLHKIFRKPFGQGTMEMALLLPIAAFLLYWVVTGFRTNHTGSDRSIQRHTKALANFQNGNGTIEIDGVDVPPAQILTLIPPSPGAGGPSLTDIVLQEAFNTVARMGLDALINAIPFLNDETYFSAGGKGFLLGAGNSFIGSGFKKVDWGQAARSGLASAIRSDEGDKDFQGDDFMAGSERELFGTGVQEALANYALTGDTYSLASGAVGGMMGSDWAKEWMSGGDELIKAAALGSIEGAIAGLKDGKLQWGEVAIAAGMSTLNTKTVAGLIPGSDWGKGGDPKKSATFGAFNAAVSTFVSGGNLGQATWAAAQGAFLSGQSVSAIAGDSQWAAMGMGAGYGALSGLIQGQEAAAIGMGALASMTQAISSQAMTQLEEAIANGGTFKSNDELAAETADDISKKLEEQYRATMEPLAESTVVTEGGEG